MPKLKSKRKRSKHERHNSKTKHKSKPSKRHKHKLNRHHSSVSRNTDSSSSFDSNNSSSEEQIKDFDDTIRNFGYTNEQNPFGDSELSTPFVWKKKQEKDRPGLKGKKLRKAVARKLNEKHKNLKNEIRNIKEARSRREDEKMKMERLRDDMQRMLDQENFELLNEKEEEFHLEQVKQRSLIRILEKREKPIDQFVKHLLIIDFQSNSNKPTFKCQCEDGGGSKNWQKASELFDAMKSNNNLDDEFDKLDSKILKIDKFALQTLNFEIESLEPRLIFDSINSNQEENKIKIKYFEELLRSIEDFLKLKSHYNWQINLSSVVRNEIEKIQRESSNKLFQSQSQHINPNILSQIDKIFASKTFEELQALRYTIEGRISNSETSTSSLSLSGLVLDYSYQEHLLQRLTLASSQAFVNRHYKLAVKLKKEFDSNMTTNFPNNIKENKKHKNKIVSKEIENFRKEKVYEKKRPAPTTPKLYHSVNFTDDLDTYTHKLLFKDEMMMSLESFFNRLALDRYSVMKSRIEREIQREKLTLDSTIDDQSLIVQGSAIAASQSNLGLTADELYQREASRAMEDDEEIFCSEAVSTLQSTYQQQDKYKPRKPQFFNRIKTGYDQNRYNQTHYDNDNPPPKIVRGYKFNIFYPDLIDPTSTPSFEVCECPDNSDYAVITFNAGPPYEDIAFKIVNKEQEESYKRGFICRFDKGVLQLIFNFRSFRYNR